jgi:hypothetical protein
LAISLCNSSILFLRFALLSYFDEFSISAYFFLIYLEDYSSGEKLFDFASPNSILGANCKCLAIDNLA